MEGSGSVKIMMASDPDPSINKQKQSHKNRGPKTYGSYGSGSVSTTLIKRLTSVYFL
jgi:hypothetical protein